MADRTFGPYPGLAIVGGGEFGGLYGVNGGLADPRGTGLQHGFLDDYRHDLIHTGTSLLRWPDGRLAYGQVEDDGLSHPVWARPSAVFNRDGCGWGATFPLPGGGSRTEVVIASAPDVITFTCEVEGPFEGDLMALVIFRGYPGAGCRINPGGAEWTGPEGKRLAVTVEGGCDARALAADSPSGFLYRTVQVLQRFRATPPAVESDQPIGVAVGRRLSLAAGERHTLRWHLGRAGSLPGDPGPFWEDWYAAGHPCPLPEVEPFYRANLAALRGAVIRGFVPADMTGQYFAEGRPSYYARDSLMIARALLLSGHYEEAGAIIRYLAGRSVKRGGEFCQRYDAAGLPSEGQHNGVPHQLDSQGYFAWCVLQFYRRTGRWLVEFDRLAAALDALADCIGPQGMAGPEGGVNEGVYGPAYITSTNMCLYGGLMAGIEAARLQGRPEAAERWGRLAERILQGIEQSWDEAHGRYGYGFVTYDPEPVWQYDTPQYFGPLYGFPLTERVRRNDAFLRRHATFFGDGIGYTEQSYHHGPWIFNTAACAQFQALAGNEAEYRAKLAWLIAHANQYGLMPEAIDAADESVCFVNPLVWGCAEAVAAVAIRSPHGGEADE
ncbi:MAG: hypothetical protein ACOY93_07025 [Bacillota bacterium]